MKAIQYQSQGDINVLEYVDTESPELTSTSDVKVDLYAAGVNPVDAKFRQGAYPLTQFPVIPGCDGAGVITEVGKDVSRFKKGDEVYFFHGGIGSIPGNYAEQKVLDERFVAKKPKSISFEEAAALPLVLITAWEALFDRASLNKDKTVFINAGAGGVGHVAIQLAKAVDARISTSISTENKASFVKELGADHVIFYKNSNTTEEILKWTNNEGVDVILDNLGGKDMEHLFSAVKHYGELVTLLNADKQIDWSQARFRNLRFSMEIMLSPQLFGLIDAQKHQTWILEECAKLIDNGKLKVHIDKTLELHEAKEAHQLIESGNTKGKIVLKIQ